jgi:hypothetical protein
LRELHKSCEHPDGTDDQKKGSQLVDIYALEIQMYTATKNNKKLKDLYHKALEIKSAIPHPRIMGVWSGESGRSGGPGWWARVVGESDRERKEEGGGRVTRPLTHY